MASCKLLLALCTMAFICFSSQPAVAAPRLSPQSTEFSPVPSVDCQSKPQSDLPFCDTSKSFMERAVDLVSRLTTAEKIGQTSTIAPAISRFGIKDYNWRSNCVHGWTSSGGHWPSDLKWTVFPAPMGLAATFDADLVMKVGQATSDEGRALHNEMLVANNGSSTEAAALNCFSPNVNLVRDPRWGRAEETFGEDPYVLSVIGSAYTRGLQEGDDNNKYMKVAACPKHYAVHNGPDNIRSHFVANVSLHDLYDTYLPAFKSQVMGAKAAQVMPAYSGVRCKYQPDGAPDAANPFLLKTVLREQFNAPNISTCSDNGGVREVYETHKYVASAELAAAVCMNATNDLDLGHDEVYPQNLQKALDDKYVEEQTITDAVVRSFYLRMMLGDFDPPSMVPYQLIDKSHLDTKENQALNLRAARESIVLLKNVKNGLPLDPKSIKNVAVLGPHGNATHTPLSNYAGIPSKVVSPLEAIQQQLSGATVNFAEGCQNPKCEDMSKFKDALDIVHSADVVFMVMGIDGSIEGEGHDRVGSSCNGKSIDVLQLPGCQNEFIEQVTAQNSKVILVLMNGGPVSLTKEVLGDDKVVAIIDSFYPGALGGTAIADVLFGNYNPGGRMPVTTFLSSDEIPPSEDYNMTTSPGRTHRYYTGTPQFRFGYGLSYTSFEYSKLAVDSTTVNPCDSVKVTVSVENTGKVAGDEVIQVYLAPPKRSDKPFFPNVQLVGFNRVNIKPGESYAATFELNPYLLSLVDEDGEHYIFPGDYTVLSANQPGDDMQKATFTISGTAPVKTSTCTSSPQCFTC